MPLSKSVMLSVFRRRGGPGARTKPFDDFETSQREVLLSRLQLEPGEEPAIASILDDQNWILITTRRTHWSKDGVVKSVAHTELRKTNIDVPPQFGKAVSKMDLNVVRLETKAGQVYEIETEPGPAFFGLLNVLKGL